ncbi:MAG: N-acetylmannosamine-6-phosphate 2-epimerase [Burkholderiales bacterium]|nr:N-acetylmannosamine-6-phosphate 2-epimerase [Burkholderiales bacterium]
MAALLQATRWNLPLLDGALRGGLVVSCQPVEGGPLDHDETVSRLAQAAVAGGARALRLEGARRLACVRPSVQVPIVGIVKRDLADSPVRITPLRQDVLALAQAGADVIAVDATRRPRPCALDELLHAIHEQGCLAMADASCWADAWAAWELGFDIIGTTLSGYTEGPVPSEPDLALVSALAQKGCRVMAEGRYDTPERAAQAIQAGAWSVTVGTALTRLELMTAGFAQGLASAQYRPSKG